MTRLMSKQNKLTSRRAVAPVIATLLLVAIAVVGGSIVFVFSQGFFSSAQISGAPQIESMQIVGYDAEISLLYNYMMANLQVLLMVFLMMDYFQQRELQSMSQNQGVAKASLTEVRFAGTVYNYAVIGTNTALEDYNAVAGFINQDEFVIVSRSNAGAAASISTATNAELQPGQIGTIYLELDETLKEGRDAQIKLTTANGAVFVGTVIAGQQSG